MKKFAPFVRWLSTKKNVQRAFRTTTLTIDNSSDPTLPTPYLTPLESLTLFRHLEDKKLVYPYPDPEGGTAYLINGLKESEWDLEESEMEKGSWQKSKTYIKAAKLIGIICLGYLGALIQKHVDSLVSKGPLKPAIEQTSNNSANKN